MLSWLGPSFLEKISCDQRYLVNFKSSLAFKAKVITGKKERKKGKEKITFFAKETFQEFVCISNVIQFKVLFKLQKTKLNHQLGSLNNADLVYGKRSYKPEMYLLNSYKLIPSDSSE